MVLSSCLADVHHLLHLLLRMHHDGGGYDLIFTHLPTQIISNFIFKSAGKPSNTNCFYVKNHKQLFSLRINIDIALTLFAGGGHERIFQT